VPGAAQHASRPAAQGTTGAPTCVVSAIVDALSVYGIRNITMSATPYNTWKATQEATGMPSA
jgi:hypothetical protein